MTTNLSTRQGSPPPTRILVVDDEAIVRAGLTLLLDVEPDLCVIGEAENGAHAVELSRTLAPDVVLMDVRMPVMDGVEATRLLTGQGVTGMDGADAGPLDRGLLPAGSGRPTPPVLVLTTFMDDTALYDCLRAGAAGFLLKSAAPRRLADAVRVVAAGDAWLDPAVAGFVLRQFLGASATKRPAPAELHRLTIRERELLALAAHGLTNDKIAAHLTISEATVRTHLGRAMAKLEVHDRAQAVVVAYRSGLVHADDPLPSH